MNDLDPTVLDVLERHYPATVALPDWEDVLGRGSARPRHRWRMVALVAAVLVGIVVPAFALSASVRDLLGFSGPVLGEARLMVSTPVGDGRVLRVWLSPSTSGGECMFTTSDPADTDKRPTQMGGGVCSGSGTVGPNGQFPMSAGIATMQPGPRWIPPTITGWLDPKLQATRVEVRSRTGHTVKLALANDYFVGFSAKLFRPSFNELPYYVIAYNNTGHEVARQKLNSYSFYLTQKKILDRTLRPYVRAHPGRHIM